MLYGTSTNSNFQLDLSQFPWEIEDFKWKFLEKLFCVSKIEAVVIWIIFSIEFLVTSLAIYGLCFLTRPSSTVPIFVINLFICDVIEICVRPIMNFCSFNVIIVLIHYIYSMSVIANVGFMVCISLERYIMIKYPVWYRLHHTCKNSLLICLIVWAVSCGFIVIDVIIAFKDHVEYAFILNVFLFLLPYPLVVFSFVGSWRALSHSVAVSPDEQKRILRILALVLFNYTVLFLPSIVQSIILSLSFEHGLYDNLFTVSGILIYLNPLADSLLYVFIRKDANSMLRCLCCEKLCENQTRIDDTSSSRTEVQINVQTYRENTIL